MVVLRNKSDRHLYELRMDRRLISNNELIYYIKRYKESDYDVYGTFLPWAEVSCEFLETGFWKLIQR